MSVIEKWLSPARNRAALGVALLVAVALAAGALGGSSGPGEPPSALGSAGPSPGDVLRGPGGKVVKGPDGKPVRVAKDGRTLLDSSGAPLRDASGKPVRLTRDGRLPRGAFELAKKRDSRGRGQILGQERRRRSRGLRGTVMLGLVFPSEEACGAEEYEVGRCPDGRAIGEAVARYVNANGGIAGRRLVMKHHAVPPAGVRPFALLDQEACEDMAAGAKPIAVISLLSGGNIQECLESHGITLLANSPLAVSQREFDAHPTHLLHPAGMAYDRWPRHYVQALDRAGFFDGDARVGFGYVRGWQPWADGEQAMRRALKEVGANVVAENGVKYPHSNAEIAPALRDIAQTVVRFRVAGVNRVVTLDAALGLGFFMGFAESQGYRPLYGVSTSNVPMGLVANAPRAQLERIVAGIGWTPLVDVDISRDPTRPPEREECEGILRGAGVPVGTRNLLGAFGTLTFCDAILMGTAALERSRRFDPVGLRLGLEGIERASATSFGTRMDAAHHDGAAGYRFLRYSKGCGCMQYEGPTRSAG